MYAVKAGRFVFKQKLRYGFVCGNHKLFDYNFRNSPFVIGYNYFSVFVDVNFRFAYIQIDATGFIAFAGEKLAQLLHVFDRAYDIFIFFTDGSVVFAYGGYVLISHFMTAFYNAFENFITGARAVFVKCHYA